MSRDLDIMTFIEVEIARVNDECGDIHACGNLRGFQDKQLELETLEKLYDELNKKFFDGIL